MQYAPILAFYSSNQESHFFSLFFFYIFHFFFLFSSFIHILNIYMLAINNGSHRRFSRPLPITTSIPNVPTKTTTNRRKILTNNGRSTCDKLQPKKRQQETPLTVLPKEQKGIKQIRGLSSLPDTQPYSASRTSPNVKRFATNQTALSTNSTTKQTKPNKNSLKINQRVIIFSSNLVGTIRYIGEPNFAKKNGTTWIGIELETKGAGKNDGSVQGISSVHQTRDSLLWRPR
ncbi:MAG: hypothetical protein EXX96DRAFT_278230 [Benjaminiella poitrasii]|nr:MAG: hypothetical protein EXX96DRAFT_278230 [Benjaminiella poitrasii]